MEGVEKFGSILVVEDDPEDRQLVEKAVAISHCADELHFVEDGEEALDYLYYRGKYSDPASAPRPGLLLLDLNLPKKNGREVLQEIKADPTMRALPVIVFSTSQAIEDIQACYDVGANSYISKPNTFVGLVKTLEALGQYWFGIVELPPSVRKR